MALHTSASEGKYKLHPLFLYWQVHFNLGGISGRGQTVFVCLSSSLGLCHWRATLKCGHNFMWASPLWAALGMPHTPSCNDHALFFATSPYPLSLWQYCLFGGSLAQRIIGIFLWVDFLPPGALHFDLHLWKEAEPKGDLSSICF